MNNLILWKFYNIGEDSLPISPISQSPKRSLQTDIGLKEISLISFLVSGVPYRSDSRRLIEVFNQNVTYLIFWAKETPWRRLEIYWSHLFPCWDLYKVRERNGHRIYCGPPKFLNPMADNSSLDLCPGASPAESVNEKQQFDPCATTTEVPINATSTSLTVCLEDPDPHHHNLSTLRLLFAHIGYVYFIYYVLISWPIHSAALTLFLATTDAVRSTKYFPMSLSHRFS